MKTLNPKPLAPHWFFKTVYEVAEGHFISDAIVQRLWEALMAKGNHTCDPYFHIWELHIPTYFPADGYAPDQY